GRGGGIPIRSQHHVRTRLCAHRRRATAKICIIVVLLAKYAYLSRPYSNRSRSGGVAGGFARRTAGLPFSLPQRLLSTTQPPSHTRDLALGGLKAPPCAPVGRLP